MRARVAALLAIVILSLGLVAGCGGGDGDSTTTVTTETGGGKPIGNGSDFDAQAVYDRAAPGVVTVISVFDNGGGNNNLEEELEPEGGQLPPDELPQAGQGSGFVISEEGEIVTNAHVVTDAQGLTVGQEPQPINQASEVFVQFPDRNSVAAEVIGYDPFADVALIKVDPEGLDLQPVEIGNIEDVGVGEQVAAIGSPFGERQSLSVGFVSALDRSIPSLTSFQIDGAIQTDASINPGNSGGPLLDSQAKVIGINQQIDTTSGGNQGVGFAVPVDLFERSVEQLREDGEVEYAYIGVGTKPLFPQLAEELEVDADRRRDRRGSDRWQSRGRGGPCARRPGDRLPGDSLHRWGRHHRLGGRRGDPHRGGSAADRLASRTRPGGQAGDHPRRRGDGAGHHSGHAAQERSAARLGLGRRSTRRHP